MASNPPGDCCKTGFFRTGKPQGTHKDIFGVSSYVVGEEYGSDRVLVMLTDIFGKDIENPQLVADELSKNGKYQVLVPDLFQGDPYLPKDPRPLPEWIGKYLPIATSITADYVAKVKSEWKPKFFAGIGYCLGAKFVVPHIVEGGVFDAAALCHPSLITEEEVGKIVKPLLISASYVDHIFTPELRAKTEVILSKLSEEIGLDWQINLFSKVTHGYAVRGDRSDPAVSYAMDTTIIDQIRWFSRF